MTAPLSHTLQNRDGPFSNRPTMRLFAGDRRGAAAVEFALVSSALLLTIVFIMMLGLVLYLGQALDRATALASRQIMIGAVQKAGLGQSAFRTSILCPALPAAMNCNDVIVNVKNLAKMPVANLYYSLINGTQTGVAIPTLSNAGASFDPGIQGDYIYVQIVYPMTFLPSFMSSIVGASASYNGTPAYLAVSTATFRNEQY